MSKSFSENSLNSIYVKKMINKREIKGSHFNYQDNKRAKIKSLVLWTSTGVDVFNYSRTTFNWSEIFL